MSRPSQKALMREALRITEGNLSSLISARPSDHVLMSDWRNVVRRALGHWATVEGDTNPMVAARDLYVALLNILETPLTTCDPRDPADWPRLVEFWERERQQGRGDAPYELAAYAALAKARGEAA